MSKVTRHLRPIRGGQPEPPPRRRRDWRDFRAEHPLLFYGLVVGLAGFLVVDATLLVKRHRYLAEARSIRAGLSAVERRQADAILARNESRMQRLELELALLQRQARVDDHLHLTIAVDSAVMRLERDGAVLREMPIQLGPERSVGTAPDTVRLATPRGTRTIERVLSADSSWEVPEWVYVERGLAAPAERVLRGALGPAAIVLSGGTVVYAMPEAGPLNDSAYVMPGAVRVRADDLRAVTPNLKAGMAVYLY
ncbi:MAG TPA: hypothetical protein VEA99_06480 [Gemmatimonadaceae bacterium]|nr:hypothetical protein [Gemmatimonadaceae bacterium]